MQHGVKKMWVAHRVRIYFLQVNENGGLPDGYHRREKCPPFSSLRERTSVSRCSAICTVQVSRYVLSPLCKQIFCKANFLSIKPSNARNRLGLT